MHTRSLHGIVLLCGLSTPVPRRLPQRPPHEACKIALNTLVMLLMMPKASRQRCDCVDNGPSLGGDSEGEGTSIIPRSVWPVLRMPKALRQGAVVWKRSAHWRCEEGGDGEGQLGAVSRHFPPFPTLSHHFPLHTTISHTPTNTVEHHKTPPPERKSFYLVKREAS